jgi:hypothetical protein
MSEKAVSYGRYDVPTARLADRVERAKRMAFRKAVRRYKDVMSKIVAEAEQGDRGTVGKVSYEVVSRIGKKENGSRFVVLTFPNGQTGEVLLRRADQVILNLETILDITVSQPSGEEKWKMLELPVV